MSRDHSTENCTYGNVKFRCTADGTIQIKLADDPPTKRWVGVNKLPTFESMSLYSALRLLNHETFLYGLQTQAVDNMLQAVISEDEMPDLLRPEYYEVWELHQQKECLHQDHAKSASNATQAQALQKAINSDKARSIEPSPSKRRKMTAAKGVGTFKPTAPVPKSFDNALVQTEDVLFCEAATEIFVYLEDLTDYRYPDVYLKKIIDAEVCDDRFDAISKLDPPGVTRDNCGNLPLYKVTITDEYVIKAFDELATQDSLRATSNAYGRISCKVRCHLMAKSDVTRLGAMNSCLKALEEAISGARCQRTDLIANLVLNDFLVWYQQRFHGFTTVEINVLGHMILRLANVVNKPKNPDLCVIPPIEFHDLSMFPPLAKLYLKREREG